MYRTIIFHSSALSSVSPAVLVWWPGEILALFNLLPADRWYFGGTPGGACAAFLGGCLAVPGTSAGTLEVHNLPLRWDRQDELAGLHGSPKYAEEWRGWLHEELRRLDEVGERAEPPVLVDLEPPYHVTRGDEVLCRRVDLCHDHWEPGQPLWVVPE